MKLGDIQGQQTQSSLRDTSKGLLPEFGSGIFLSSVMGNIHCVLSAELPAEPLTAGRTGTDSGGPGTRRVTTASPSGEPTLPQGLPPTPAPHCWWEMSQAGHLSPRKTSLSCAEWGGPRVLPTRAPSAFPLRGGDASRWSFLQLHPARAPASPPATTMQVQLRREAGVRFFLLFMPFATKLSVSKYEKKNLNGL